MTPRRPRARSLRWPRRQACLESRDVAMAACPSLHTASGYYSLKRGARAISCTAPFPDTRRALTAARPCAQKCDALLCHRLTTSVSRRKNFSPLTAFPRSVSELLEQLRAAVIFFLMPTFGVAPSQLQDAPPRVCEMEASHRSCPPSCCPAAWLDNSMEDNKRPHQWGPAEVRAHAHEAAVTLLILIY